MPEISITKKIIAQALKQLCEHRSFDKITIGDLAKSCGLGRQTFYYHFQDKYELLEWIYSQELFIPLCQDIRLDNWPRKMEELLFSMEREQAFYTSTIKSSSDLFNAYFIKILQELLLEALEELDKEHSVSDESRKFYARFFSYGASGVVIEWVKNGMQIPAVRIAASLDRMMYDIERITLKAGAIVGGESALGTKQQR